MVSLRKLLVFLLPGAPLMVSGAFRSYNFSADPGSLNRRQDGNATTLSVGFLGQGLGPIPQRLEIRQLKQNEHQWNLYILALSLLYDTDTSRPDSWYQIAGIHGFPYEPWNGVQGMNVSIGYCNHASILFPSWHRPYLSLVEQQLYVRTMWVAEQFNNPSNKTEGDAYRNAAANWRMPFWDWASQPEDGSPVYLPEFGQKDIHIYGPNGWQTISNPLYSYHFTEQDMLRFNFATFRRWNETKRVPSSDRRDAVSQNQIASDDMDAALPNLQQRLFNLFTAYGNYAAFSNKKYNVAGNDSDFESIESVHDKIHMTVGGKGHMEYIVYSAFDPIFFLHHTNVDRLTAMWQALHPFSYVTPWPASEATFTSAVREMQHVDTPLTPFSTVEGTFWTSQMLRETTLLGYEYQDTAGFNLSTPSDETKVGELKNVIIEKYGRSSPAYLANLNQKRSVAEQALEDKARKRFLKGAFKAGKFVPNLSQKSFVPCPPTSAIIKGNHYTEWIANVRLKNSDINGPASVLFFLGAVPANARHWQRAQNLVGSLGVFAMKGASNPDNEVTGTVPITAALMKLVSVGLVPSMDPEDMDDYLRQYLRFRVTGVGGVPIEPSQMEGLRIRVASAKVLVPSSDSELPTWEEMETRFSMT